MRIRAQPLRDKPGPRVIDRLHWARRAMTPPVVGGNSLLRHQRPMLLLALMLSGWGPVAVAAVCHVRTGGGTGSGIDDANAWSYAHLNATRLAAGDTVLFRRGDTFSGILSVSPGASGSGGVAYGAYGSGPDPVLTGLVQLTSWTLLSGNIYYATLDVPRLNLVTVDGTVRAMGRYPNAGYLSYEGHSGNTSITDNQLSATPNWTGGEVVIRKYRWILDRHPITGHTGSTLAYSSSYSYGNSAFYHPIDGNGYFIQGHIAALDTLGEWCHDPSSKRLYVHFGTGTPSGRVVKAATVESNISGNASHVAFNDLVFEGANMDGARLVGATNTTFNRCTFARQGGNGLYAGQVANLSVSGGSIVDALNNGIWVEYGGSHCTVDGVACVNAGIIPGAGRSGDGAQQGISITGEHTMVVNCTVTNSGYNGIHFNGSDALVERNVVDRFCTVKDDGGGIYTYHGSASTTLSNRLIRDNVILNAIGAYPGCEAFPYEAFGKAAGVYLDGFSNHTDVVGNSIAHGEWGGIFVNSNRDNRLVGNTVFDHAQQVLISVSTPGAVRGLTVTDNTLVARTSAQKTLQVDLFANDDPRQFGVFDRNAYARPIAEGSTLAIDHRYSGGGGLMGLTLAGWRSAFAHDAASTISPVAITAPERLVFHVNGSPLSATRQVTGPAIDMRGRPVAASLVLQPFSSAMTIRTMGTLQFTASTYVIDEGDRGTVSALVTVSRLGESAGAVGVTYATTAGTAAAGPDFTVVSGTLAWADGQAGTKSFSVPVLGDTLLEAFETVGLTLSAPTGGAVLGSPAAAILEIANDEPAPAGSLQCAAATLVQSEGASTAAVSVSRVGGSFGAVGASYAIVAGTATAGVDYTAAGGTLAWGDGDSAAKTVYVSVIPDGVAEPGETLTVTVTSSTGGAVLGLPNATELTIVDDDGPGAAAAGDGGGGCGGGLALLLMLVVPLGWFTPGHGPQERPSAR
jgi:parallel beta-helix repeat protein